MIANRSCPLCSENRAERVEMYSPEEWDLVSCTNCCFVYLKNPPEYQDLEEQFAWEKTYIQKS